MRHVRLDSVAEIDRNGIAPESIQSGTRYLGLEHIESGGRILSSEPIKAGELASTKFRFGQNHLLYGKLRPYLGKIALPDFEGVCSTDIVPVRPGPDLDRRYLAYFLRQPSMIDYANSRSTGANLPRLSPRALGKLLVPVPSLPEQRRIAAILDQADALRRLRHKSLSTLSALKQSIFNDMFGRTAAPKNVPINRLVDLADLINGDRSSNYPSGADIMDVGIPFLSTTNLKNGQLDLTLCNFITEPKFASLSRGKLARDDIVITLRGTLGQCALFDCEYDTGFINAQMMIIRCSPRIMPRYLQEFLSLPSVQSRLRASNSGTAVPQLTAAQMKELEIVVPDLSAQREFVERFDTLDGVARSGVVQLNDLDSLFTSLQHRAFRGEL